MPSSFSRTALLVAVVLVTLFGGPNWAAGPQMSGVRAVPRALMKLELDYIAEINTDTSDIKPGAIVDVYLLSGKKYEGLTIGDMKAGPKPNTFRTLTFKPSKGSPSKLAPNTLYQLKTRERSFDVVTDTAAKAWVLLDQTKRDEVAARRLEARGNHLWQPPSTEEVQRATEYYEGLFAKARAEFPQLRFNKVETQYFVSFTDMPPAQVAGYVANLDKMYNQLCTLFSVPAGTNLWVGKCPVIAFADAETFYEFEAKHMDNPNARGAQGLNHQISDGRVVTVVYRGQDPTYFAVVLVHETAHGFLHRIRSSSHIPPWMNEGISEWVASVVVPQSNHIAARMSDALPRMRASGSLGGDLIDDAGGIEAWQYGVAAQLTQYLLSTDPNAYRGLITAIKEGYTWKEGLELTYGITPQEMVSAYGRQIGIPQLRP